MKNERLRLLKECVKLYEIANEICYCDGTGGGGELPVSAEGETGNRVSYEEDDENQCADSEKTFEKALHETLQRSCFNEIFPVRYYRPCEYESLEMTRKNRFVRIYRELLEEYEIQKVDKIFMDSFVESLHFNLADSDKLIREQQTQYLITNPLADCYR